MISMNSIKAAQRMATVGVKRGFAGGSHAPPKYTGIEAKVRSVLVKDEHLVLGIIGFYTIFGIGLNAYLSRSKKETVAPVPLVAPVTSTGNIPSMESEDFDVWIQIPGNENKWFASLDT